LRVGRRRATAVAPPTALRPPAACRVDRAALAAAHTGAVGTCGGGDCFKRQGQGKQRGGPRH
jgi:hypothetical protein